MKVCLKAVTGFYILFGPLQVKRLYFSFCSIACKQTINRKKKKKGENFLKTKYLCQSNILEVFFVEKFLMFWDFFLSLLQPALPKNRQILPQISIQLLPICRVQSSAHELSSRNDTAIV